MQGQVIPNPVPVWVQGRGSGAQAQDLAREAREGVERGGREVVLGRDRGGGGEGREDGTGGAWAGEPRGLAVSESGRGGAVRRAGARAAASGVALGVRPEGGKGEEARQVTSMVDGADPHTWFGDVRSLHHEGRGP